MYEEPKCYKCPDEKDHYHDHHPVPHYPQHHQHYAHTYPVPAPAPHMPAPPPLEWSREPGCPCEKGERGPQGYPGERGPQGQEGLRGPAGQDGLDGSPGQTGPVGPEGPQGERGDEGDRGPQGERGDQGIQGAQGPQGNQGEIGPQGDQGIQGAQGPQGDQGIQGQVGNQGDQGIQGNPGSDGLDAVVACQDNVDDNTCIDLTLNTPTGEKTITVSKCISLFSCGYTGTPQCEIPTGAPTSLSDTGTQFVDLNLPRDSGQIILQDVPGATNTISNVTTSVEGDYSCVEWEQTGEVNFNILVNTNGLPFATKAGISCHPPTVSNLRLEAPDGTILNRKTGGDQTNGWSGGTLSDGTVYNELTTVANFLGKDPEAEFASGGVFSADFRGNGRMKVCYQHCYLEAVAVQTSGSGTVQEICDSTGEIDVNTPYTPI